MARNLQFVLNHSTSSHALCQPRPFLLLRLWPPGQADQVLHVIGDMARRPFIDEHCWVEKETPGHGATPAARPDGTPATQNLRYGSTSGMLWAPSAQDKLDYPAHVAGR